MVRLFELIKSGKQRIEEFCIDTPQLDAEVILSHILNKDRMYLYLNREVIIDEAIVNEFNKLIDRRCGSEPMAYITGTKEFMGLDFNVKPGVLIPRGDTEILVDAIIKRIKIVKNPVVVDIGCGSGAIAISIAKYDKNAVVYALDIMDTPLEVAKFNAINNGVGERVNVIKSDILNSLHKRYENSIDVIVSNPPYIEENVIPTLMMDVKNFEPLPALLGGKDGLDFYRKITKESIKFLRNNGLIAYEIGYNQREEVVSILRAHGFYNIECIKDLGGNDRVVLGYLSK